MGYIKGEKIYTGIVPTPKKVENLNKENKYAYEFINSCIYTDCNDFNTAIKNFSAYFSKVNNIQLAKKQGGIEIINVDDLRNDEYLIEVRNNSITVSASSAVGCNHALSTLLQLLYCQNSEIYAPQISIADYPELKYRGVMVDLGREFHPFNTLLRYVDLCYFYKINKLHLHLTDGPLYTLPSKSLPKLPNEGKSYTKEEISILVEYAKEREIEIIPEIEVPGHCGHLIETYPEIFKLDRDDSEKKTDVTCMCRPVAVAAMKKLFDEVIELFPYSESIHIGGDEAELEFWNECKVCKQYMLDNHIEDVKHLYSHIIKIFTDYILSKGKKPLAWEGFPQENSESISRETTICEFSTRFFLPNDIAKAGFNIINCSWEPLYITPYKFWYIKDVLEWNIYTFMNHGETSPAYLNPIVVEDKEKVKGAQVCVWELNYEQEIERVKEIVSAFIERTWTIKRVIDTNTFTNNYNDNVKPLINKLLDERIN